MIKINMQKAIEIAHGHRRAKRAEEFAPLDEQFMLKIPGTDEAAVETQRQAIRDKHAVIQADIDACTDPDSLRQLLRDTGIV